MRTPLSLTTTSPLHKIDDMAYGRKRLRNLAAATYATYGETFLDRTDPSASRSGTTSAQEYVPESQSQGRSSAHEYAPLVQYELPPYYPQYEADYQPRYEADYQPRYEADYQPQYEADFQPQCDQPQQRPPQQNFRGNSEETQNWGSSEKTDEFRGNIIAVGEPLGDFTKFRGNSDELAFSVGIPSEFPRYVGRI
ncbi:hypothetical protein F2Q69_00035325 [Brassica cretica]|uniref:Uncharacterized protein n=1 Tax=Brassica cretica TaxID=69181 RepID=A0A8S9SMM9_BRACR|nr:hypothetical protein F2Q69_00035325 [Brassica cretica]